ncbi:MAG: SEC-C domain-containing protein [Gammaproteobacteria bacterium]|nr:SEC-C domain-containing protein [Gammaproteobacteria bacterium]
MPQEISRNEPCPCGSEKKYEDCCLGKNFKWVRRNDGSIYKEIQLNEEMLGVLKNQRKKFIERFGREPGPKDPVFFEMHEKGLGQVQKEIMDVIAKANYSKGVGIDPAKIYAYQKTGIFLTESNKQYFSNIEIEEWQRATQEFQLLVGANKDITVHDIAVASLRNKYTNLSVKGFKKAFLNVLKNCRSVYAHGFLKNRFNGMPDGYILDNESKELRIFEVEDSHALPPDKLSKYLALWHFVDTETDWKVRIIVTDRYANEQELDCAKLWKGLQAAGST